MAERLRLIFDGLQALIGEHQPAEVAVERVFGSHGGASGPGSAEDDGPLGTYGKFNAPP